VFRKNHLHPALEAGKYTIRGASPTWPPWPVNRKARKTGIAAITPKGIPVRQT